MGQILECVFIMGPNGRSAIHIEAAVAPGEHVFDDSIRDLAFGLEHFKDLIAEEVLQIFRNLGGVPLRAYACQICQFNHFLLYATLRKYLQNFYDRQAEIRPFVSSRPFFSP